MHMEAYLSIVSAIISDEEHNFSVAKIFLLTEEICCTNISRLIKLQMRNVSLYKSLLMITISYFAIVAFQSSRDTSSLKDSMYYFAK